MDQEQKYQKEKEKELERQKDQEQQQYQEHDASSKECPNCGAQNEIHAKFCGECGYQFGAVTTCPKCHSKVDPLGDICEVCGEWLLKDKCKFCYASITESDAYCPECGNPTAGIVCGKCGQLSCFDFCKNCHIPLTEFAEEAIKEAQADPEILEIQKMQEEILKAEAELEQQADLEAQQELEEQKKIEKERMIEQARKLEQHLKNFYDKKKNEVPQHQVPKHSRPAKKNLFGSGDGGAVNAAAERAVQLAKKRELQKKLNEQKKKTFSKPQEARRFFAATKPPVVLGWKCNFTDTQHDCPEDCARPELGGIWIII